MLGQLTLFPPDGTLPLRQRIQIERITARQARYTLEQFHYLHRARVGRQINYAVLIDGQVDGVITYAYPMMSAPLLGVSSTEMVEFARLYLHQNIPHAASCAIGKSLRRLRADWELAFPRSPGLRLVVSWSDTFYHKGTIYKASNFQWVRRTHGDPPRNKETSRRGPRAKHSDYRHDKDCWVFWLDTPSKGQAYE